MQHAYTYRGTFYGLFGWRVHLARNALKVTAVNENIEIRDGQQIAGMPNIIVCIFRW